MLLALKDEVATLKAAFEATVAGLQANITTLQSENVCLRSKVIAAPDGDADGISTCAVSVASDADAMKIKIKSTADGSWLLLE